MAPQPISEPTPASAPAITPAYRRYALLGVSLINVWAAFHYFMAGSPDSTPFHPGHGLRCSS